MTIYTVIGYERTTRMMCVEADSEEEAIAKAYDGDYSDADTEPGPLLRSPKWFVSHEGWFHGRR